MCGYFTDTMAELKKLVALKKEGKMNIKESARNVNFSEFCEKYIQINHPRYGIIPFKLYEYQKRFAQAILANRFLIGKKFRQGGFTTTALAVFLRKAMFEKNLSLVVYGRTDRDALEKSWILDSCIIYRKLYF